MWHIHQIPNYNAKQTYVEQCNVPVKKECTEDKDDCAAASKLLLTEYQNTAHFFRMNDFNIELQKQETWKRQCKGKTETRNHQPKWWLAVWCTVLQIFTGKKEANFSDTKIKFWLHCIFWRQVMCGYDAPASQGAEVSGDHNQCSAKLKIKQRCLLLRKWQRSTVQNWKQKGSIRNSNMPLRIRWC